MNRAPMYRTTRYAWLVGVLLITTFSLAASEDPPDGETLFRNHCKACHTIKVRLVGPPLEGIFERRDTSWILDFVKSSQTMIQAGDQAAVDLFNEYNQVIMPDQLLEEEQVMQILEYVSNFQTAAPSKGDILRPEVTPMARMEPLHFSDYRFWIIYTITVLLFIAFLYHMVEMTALSKELRANKKGE